MAYYSTLQELIDSVQNQEISYRNLHITADIEFPEYSITIPYSSLIIKYLPYFSSTIVTGNMTETERVKYRFKPKMLSYDLYSTTELWSAILILNNILSIQDFEPSTQIKVFEPIRFKKLLNEVLILEGIIS